MTHKKKEQHTHIDILMTRNKALQGKLTQKPLFKRPRKRANQQISSTNKISKYFVTTHNKSERGTGEEIGPSNKLNNKMQDLARQEEVRPKGQADQDKTNKIRNPGDS